MKSAQCVLALLPLALMISPIHASPILVVVPNADTNTVGNAADGLPTSDLHSQEVFDSSQFPTGTLLITEFGLRVAPGTGALSLIAALDTLSLSTTQYAPNSSGSKTLLTNTFATNIGPDNTVVYSGPVSFTNGGCSGPGVCSFTLFTFTTPFLYNPSQGNLLLDARISGITSSSGLLDSVSYSSPGGLIAV